MARKIWIVDAFTHKAYGGNPAGVMIVDDFPADAQNIAAELNLSETAFVKPLGGNHFHIRWMTPAVEVRLCGHATLAACHTLYEQGLFTHNKIQLESLSGPLFVTREDDFFILDFPLQPTGPVIDHTFLAQALGAEEHVIEAVQAHDDVIVLLESEEVLKNLTPDFAALNTIDARGIIVTAKSQHYDFVSRFFAPRVGVDEDPVTGSAHCKLADYWQKKLKKTTFKAYQLSARGGEIHLSIEKDRVHLKGKAVTIMEGLWKV